MDEVLIGMTKVEHKALITWLASAESEVNEEYESHNMTATFVEKAERACNKIRNNYWIKKRSKYGS